MPTTTRRLEQDLIHVWKKETCSFLEYLVDWSSPVVIDDTDRGIVAAFAEFRKTESGLKDRTYDLLIRQGKRPDPPGFPMNASTYNFMRPRMLAQVFLRIAENDRKELAVLRDAYAGSTEREARVFFQLLSDTIKSREDAIASVSKLLGQAKAAAEVKSAQAEAPKAEPEAASPGAASPPWHDESLALDDRMNLAKGLGLFEQLFAAMAQTDCTACGYDCEGYARAIADGEDKDLSKCAPGEEETRKMLFRLMKK